MIKAKELKKLKTEEDVVRFAANKSVTVAKNGNKIVLDGMWELTLSGGKVAFFEDKR